MRPLVLALLLLAPAPLAAQRTLPFSMGVASDVSLRVWVPSGTVRVESWDRDTVHVTGTVDPRSHFFGGGGMRGAKVGIENRSTQDKELARGDLVVIVPRRAHVWIKMTDGEVIATGTAGELEVITVTGTIAARDATGIVSIETIDGAVTLERISGAVRLRGGSGRLTLSQIGGTLTAATVSGAIDLSGSALADARLETIGGGIIVRGTVAPDALIDLETHSGPITLFLPRTAPPALALSSRTGTVTNRLVGGKIGAGRIEGRTFKGDINVLPVRGIEGK